MPTYYRVIASTSKGFLKYRNVKNIENLKNWLLKNSITPYYFNLYDTKTKIFIMRKYYNE